MDQHERHLLHKLKIPLFIINLAGDVPGVHVVALDYQVASGNSLAEKILATAKHLFQIQAHILISLLWLAHQDEYDPSRISILNVSFGTFIAPLSLRAASQFGFKSAATIFAFGGAEIKNFILPFSENIIDSKAREEWQRYIVNSLDLIEPSKQLKHLTGPFLVIRGLNDQVIPLASSEALEHSLSEPKEILLLKTRHINVNESATLQLMREAVVAFLRKHAAIP